MAGINQGSVLESTGIKQSRDNVTPEKTTEKHVIIPPRWPYEKWTIVKECEVADTEVKNQEQLKEFKPVSHHHSSTGLSTFLKVFDDDLRVFEGEASKVLRVELTTMIEDTVERLRKTHPIFQNCRLIPAGSVAEGTKIGLMDEFDYLLVLNIFSDRRLFETHFNRNFTLILTESSDYSKHIVAALPEMFEPSEVTNKLCLTNIRSVLVDIFMHDFLSNMFPGWTYWTPEGEVCSSDIATTLHLTSQNYNIDIDVDLCLCIPVSKDDCIRAIKTSKDDKNATFFEYLNLLADTTAKCLEIYAIVGSNVDVFHLKTTASRITIPMLESESFKQCDPGDGRVQTYRYVKCLARTFLPKRTQLFGCPRCCHSLVKSYDFKNIVLFMIKNHPEDEFWVPENVCCRLVEVFDLLQRCLPVDDPDRAAPISTCCTPGDVRIESIATYRQDTIASKEKSNLLYTPDSHKPVYGLGSTPEYSDSIKTDVSDIDSIVKTYFEHLKKDHWETFELVAKLCNTLTKLHSIKGEP